MAYVSNVQGFNNHTDYSSNNKHIINSTPIYQPYQSYQSYRISPQQFHQQTSYVDSQLEKSRKLIQNIKMDLPSFSAYSMANTSSSTVKNSALIQSKYEINRISQQPDQQVSNDSIDDPSTTVQSQNKPLQIPYVYKSDSLFSMNVNQSEAIIIPFKESFTKVSSRFSPFSELNFQIEQEKIYCIICQQNYRLLDQRDHLIKHRNKYEKKGHQKQHTRVHIETNKIVQQTIKPQKTEQNVAIGKIQTQNASYSMQNSITFGRRLNMENSYSIIIEANKQPQSQHMQVSQAQQILSQQSQRSYNSSHNQIPNTVQTGVQVSLKSSSYKSNPQSQSFIKSKPSNLGQFPQNDSHKSKTQNILIQLQNYQLSNKGSSSQKSGSFAFSQEKIIHNHQPRQIMNFYSRIESHHQSNTCKKSAKSLQCTYGKNFFQDEAVSRIMYQKSKQENKNSKSSREKSVYQVNQIKSTQKKSKRSQKSRQSGYENNNEASPCFKQVVSIEPRTVGQIHIPQESVRLGLKLKGNLQKVEKPSCQQQSLLSMSDFSMVHQDENKIIKRQKSVSITEHDYRKEKDIKHPTQQIIIQDSKPQTLRSQVSPFKKSSKPRVHQEIIRQNIKSQTPHEHQVQSRKATISTKTKQALKKDGYPGFEGKQTSQGGKSKNAKNIFAQSQKGRNIKE